MTGLYIFLFLAIALIVLVVINEIMSSRSRTHQTAIKLKAALIDHPQGVRLRVREAFIGQDLDYCLDRLGIYTQGGSMDRGADAYNWRAENVWVEAWFQDGICVSFAERDH
jgi:hypothetical protein